MLALALELPDAVVGFATRVPDAVGEALDHVPELGRDEAAFALIDRHAVDHRPEDIELSLAGGAVADANRTGPFVACEVLEERFGEVRVAGHPIEDLHGKVVGVGAVADPVDEVDSFLLEACAKEGRDAIGSVTEPAVPVVPVAIATGIFRDGRGRCGAQGTGRRVGEQLDHQGGAPDGGLNWPLIETLLEPSDPERPRALGELGRVTAAGEPSSEGEVTLAEPQRDPDLRPGLDGEAEDVARPSVDFLHRAVKRDVRRKDHLLRAAGGDDDTLALGEAGARTAIGGG